jgi:hypothetical protein
MMCCCIKSPHLEEVKMSYSSHCVFSSMLGMNLFVGSLKAYIHGCFPDCFVTSSTDLTEYLSLVLSNHDNASKIVF